ncbi:MAG: hypothetical protein H6555_02700 [Lewinellaceae bacterium]|nr:hypothetical protein [Lewinellaceae bacterium]
MHFDDQSYQQMLQWLGGLHFQEIAGDLRDLDFISQDVWLANTVVIDWVVRRKGCWEIHLVFASQDQPLRFLSRFITSNPSLPKTQMMAGYMRRLAAKDQRGTLTLSVQDFGLSLN